MELEASDQLPCDFCHESIERLPQYTRAHLQQTANGIPRNTRPEQAAGSIEHDHRDLFGPGGVLSKSGESGFARGSDAFRPVRRRLDYSKWQKTADDRLRERNIRLRSLYLSAIGTGLQERVAAVVRSVGARGPINIAVGEVRESHG